MKGYVLTMDVVLAFGAFFILLLIILSLLETRTTSNDQQLYYLATDIGLVVDESCGDLEDADIREIIENTPWNVCAEIRVYDDTDNLIYSTIKSECDSIDSEISVSYFSCQDLKYGRVKTWYR
ncbi:hypothetical protein KO465_00465 [Candidatus Micrarchaeota archaeon]|jgi:hypothetical protein|nr:hypothetical protein [Candidatus Micrarchaeota archaeon]